MTIALAATHYRYEARRETDALEQLDYTTTRFWQRVNYLIDQPAAQAVMPMEVSRLRRLRDRRSAAR